jgi:hypothetical protein
MSWMLIILPHSSHRKYSIFIHSPNHHKIASSHSARLFRDINAQQFYWAMLTICHHVYATTNFGNWQTLTPTGYCFRLATPLIEAFLVIITITAFAIRQHTASDFSSSWYDAASQARRFDGWMAYHAALRSFKVTNSNTIIRHPSQALYW